MVCTDQGSKCDSSGNICYYNVQTCVFDCLPCSSGTYCAMQGGIATCVEGCIQQDYTISLSKTSVVIGGSVIAKVKMSGYPGKTWKVIQTNAPSGDVVLGEGILDSYSCVTITLPFNALGSYTLKGRVCDVWNVGAASSHCLLYDTDTNNSVTLTVVNQTPPGVTSCDPTTCDPNSNLCVLGQCVPKPIIFAGAGLLVLYMLTR